MPNSKKPRKPKPQNKSQYPTKNTAAGTLLARFEREDRKRNVRLKLAYSFGRLIEFKGERQDVHELQRVGQLYEAMCLRGFGGRDEQLCKDYDAAMWACLNRGDKGLSYGFNPKELEAVLTVKENFTVQLSAIPAQTFFDLDLELIKEKK